MLPSKCSFHGVCFLLSVRSVESDLCEHKKILDVSHFCLFVLLFFLNKFSLACL